MTNHPFYPSLSHQGSQIAKKHESYTSVAISGAQDCLAESERGGERQSCFRCKYHSCKDDTVRAVHERRMFGFYL